MEIDILYPPSDLVINRVVRCAACGKPTTAVSYARSEGIVKTNCKCDGKHFQSLIPATSGAGA